MHIKNESLKQYTEGIKAIFQRCQHKCEVSLFTKHTTNVAELALQTYKEDKSGTPRKAAQHQQGQGKGWFWCRASPLCCAHPLDYYSLIYRYERYRECEHHTGALRGIPLREKLLLLLFTSLLALTTLSQLVGILAVCLWALQSPLPGCLRPGQAEL